MLEILKLKEKPTSTACKNQKILQTFKVKQNIFFKYFPYVKQISKTHYLKQQKLGFQKTIWPLIDMNPSEGLKIIQLVAHFLVYDSVKEGLQREILQI